MPAATIIRTFVMSIALLGCSEHRTEDLLVKDCKNLKEDLRVIGQERIFFGHQSVGANILDGLKTIINENSKKNLNFLYLTDSLHISQNYFIDGFIGENLNPKSKFNDYVRIVEKLNHANLSVALMKLCYIDITQQSNVDQIFDEYVSAIEYLKQKYPSIIFVHVTVPLTTEADLARRIYRSFRGRTIDYVADNGARESYNEKLRKHFASEPIFDLALFESTHPNGSREGSQAPSGAYYNLVKEYASDEGHLNEYGRKIVARELLRTIAQAARDRIRE
jgi:lysophospholipase L1-like esterase